MIQFGAKINATEGNGRTPLILATQMTDLEMVEIFLKYKAVVVHIDLEYNNALTYGIPGETCYQVIRKAMTPQPKRTEGTGLIDGRLRTSQKLGCNSKVPKPILSRHKSALRRAPIHRNK